MLTRGEAAKRLGLSVARIRQLEEDGTLWPTRDANGWHWFWEDDIESLLEDRAEAKREPFDLEPVKDGRRSICRRGR
jgi:DNA-binding transcriptional MerR regulator